MFLALIGAVLFIMSFCLEPVTKLLQAKQVLDKKKHKSNNSLGAKFVGGRRILDKFKIGSKSKSPSEKREKAKQVALNSTILALKSLGLFLKSCSSVLVSLGSITSLLAMLPIIMIIACLGSVVVFAQTTEGGNFIQGYIPGGNTNSDSDIVSDQSILASIETVANCYINEGKEYNQGKYVNISCLGTGTVRLDCTGFCQALVRYHMGERDTGASNSTIPLTGSKYMLSEGCSWDTALTSAGWTRIAITNDITIENLQPGDMLGGDGHFEIWLGNNKTFGWGSVKTKYPSSENYNLVKVDGGFKYSWNGGSHTYTVIYRYTGN